jgi:hypothetical protein
LEGDDVSPKAGRRFAIANGLVVVVLVCMVGMFAALSLDDGRIESKIVSNLFYIPLMLLLAVVGGLIVAHRPNNRIGLGMCLVASLASLLGITEAYVEYDLYEDSRALPAADLAAWLVNWLWVWVLLTPITFLFLLAPDGHLPAPRWRWALRFDLLTMAILTLTQMFHAGPFEDFPTIENPLGIGAIDPVLEALTFLGFILLLPAIGLSGAGLVMRFRSSEGREHLQLKWLAAAAVGALLIFAASWPISIFGPEVWGFSTVAATALLPLAIGIAILRHNLYGIDRIINKTLVYVPLTAILAGLFVAVTGLIRAVFTDLTDAGSDAATALSTLAVVAVLTPAKNYLQAFVDSHFKQQHDPEKALKELVGEALFVTRILDREQFITSVMEEVSAALGVSGAAVEFSSGASYQSGRVGETTPVSVALVFKGAHIGQLTVWPREDGDSDHGQLVKALEGPADALARVIGISPEPSSLLPMSSITLPQSTSLTETASSLGAG